MIGSVTTTIDIPAGAVIYFDSSKNGLVVFDGKTERLLVIAMPFLSPDLAPDKRVKLP